MGLFILLLLILLLAVAGILGFIVKVALGVALGLVAAVAIGAWAVRRRFRRALYGSPRGPRPPRRIGSSRVEVIEHPDHRHQA